MAEVPDVVTLAPTAVKGNSLGDLLDSLSSHQPHTIEFPESITAMEACGNDVVIALYDGKVLLVSVSPVPISYNLESDNPHSQTVRRLVVSQDQEICLSSDEDNHVKMWSLLEKKQKASLFQTKNSVTGLAITHNSRIGIIASYDSPIKVWDLQSNTELFSLESTTDRGVMSVALSLDDRFLYSGHAQGMIRVWDLEERSEKLASSCHQSGINGLSLAPDKDILWSWSTGNFSSDPTARAWDLTDWKETNTFTCPLPVHHMYWTPEGNACIVLSKEKEVQVWDPTNNRKIADVTGHTETIYDSTVFANQKCCLSSSEDGTIKMWDLEMDEEVEVFLGHEHGVKFVKLTEDNLHFISGADKTLKIWSLTNNHEKKIPGNFEVWFVIKEYIYGSLGGNVTIWRWDGQRVGILQSTQERIFCMEIGADQRTLVLGGEKNIEIWSLGSRTLGRTFPNEYGYDLCLAFTPDGQQFITAEKHGALLTLWSIWEEGKICSAEIPKLYANTWIIRPTGDCVVTASWGGIISIWGLPRLELLGTLTGHSGQPHDLAFTSNGRTLISCGEEEALINIWDFDQRCIIASYESHVGEVYGISTSYDDQYVVSTGADCTVRVWSLVDRREVACYKSTERYFKVRFNGDSTYIACFTDERSMSLIPFTVPWECMDMNSCQITSENAVIIKNCSSGKRLGKRASELLLTPYHVNCLHISAYYNYDERCSEHLAVGVPILKGTFGSPITVALQRKTIKCVEVFLQYLIDKAEETGNDTAWPVFACITDDIPSLLGCGSRLLQPFFGVLMQLPATPALPYFITPRSTLPIAIASKYRLLNVPDFDISPKGETGSELVKFAVSLIRQDLSPGSTKSLKLVEALQGCEDKTVLTTPYVSLLIEQKWNYFYSFTLTFTLLYAAMLASLVMMLFKVWDSRLLPYTFIATNGFFVLYEMAQMVVDKSQYWTNSWNYVDIFRGLLSIFWGTLMLQGQEQSFLTDYARDVRLLLALLCLLRGFTYFRSFRMTRLFVYMTLAVIKEMYSFLFIMGYSVFAFGVCTSILAGHTTLGASWISAFSLILGDFDSSAFGFLEWVVFSCAAIINVIIMLNLLVSILGDAYEQTQLSMHENDLYMMLDLVNEYESLMFWRRFTGTPVIMFTCDGGPATESVTEWAGQVTRITEKVKEEIGKVTLAIEGKLEDQKAELKEAHGKVAETIEKKLEEVDKRIGAMMEEKLRTMEGKMEMKMGEIGQKLEAIMAFIRDRD